MPTPRFVATVTTLVWTALAFPSGALEVDRAVLPRLTVGGRALATPTFEWDQGAGSRGDDDSQQIDISDSAILLRVDKRIYSELAVAGAVLGLRKTATDSEEDDVFFHELHAFFWNQDLEALVGRSRLRNTLIELPTVRDEDLLAYAYVPNGSSVREAEEDQLFAPQASFTWYVDGKNHGLSLWTAARVETDGDGDTKDRAELNSLGGGWSYEVSEDLVYVDRLRHAGVLVDVQWIDDSAAGLDDDAYAVIAGAELNLNRDPAHNWAASVQGIYFEGAHDAEFTPSADDDERRAQLRSAESWSLVGSLMYTHRPNLLTRARAALTLAYRDYPDENDASEFAFAPSVLYRLGHAIDLVGQYLYQHRDEGLAAMTGADDVHTLVLGVSVGFDMAFNDQIGERRSILNLEYGGLP